MKHSKIKKLIANGHSDSAINDLITFTKSLPDQQLKNNLLQLSARWKSNEQSYKLQGTISINEYNIEKNKINNALLILIDELEQAQFAFGQTDSTQVNPDLLENTMWKKIGYVAIIAGILGGFAEFFNFLNIFPNSKDGTLQLTVYVQSLDGKPIHELQNNGRILVDFGNDRRGPMIGENGRTNLGEIPEKFKGKEIPIILQADGYELVEQGKKYIMNGEPIYLSIQKDSKEGLLRGIVKDRRGELFIANAMVMVDNDTTTTTDSLGRFRLQLPKEKQHDRYLITVKKSGYTTYTDFYLPLAGTAEIRLDKIK